MSTLTSTSTRHPHRSADATRKGTEVRDRRRLVLLAASALGLLAVACGSSNASQAHAKTSTINIYVTSDSNEQKLWYSDYVPGFEKAFPQYKIKLTFDLSGSDASEVLDNLVQSNLHHQPAQFDVMASLLSGTQYLQDLLPISEKNVPNIKNVLPNFLTGTYGHGVPYHTSWVILLYNSAKVQTPPHTMAQLISWIREHPGQFTYCPPADGGSGGSFVESVVGQHVPPADNQAMILGNATQYEHYWSAGIKLLHSINADIYDHGIYPNSNEGPIELLGKNQIEMTVAWSDETLTAFQQHVLNSSDKVSTIVDPGLTGGQGGEGLVIPKNAPDRQGALKLVNWLLEPGQQAGLVYDMQTYPVISFSALPTKARNIISVEKVNPAGFHNDYSQDVYNDLAKLWQQDVPG